MPTRLCIGSYGDRLDLNLGQAVWHLSGAVWRCLALLVVLSGAVWQLLDMESARGVSVNMEIR